MFGIEKDATDFDSRYLYSKNFNHLPQALSNHMLLHCFKKASSNKYHTHPIWHRFCQLPDSPDSLASCTESFSLKDKRDRRLTPHYFSFGVVFGARGPVQFVSRTRTISQVT